MSRGFGPTRALALVVLTAVLIGVPCVVVATVGQPFPGPAQLTAAWHQRRVPGDLVVHVGASLFALLWAWFAVTAIGEFALVGRARRSGSAGGLGLPPVADGPSRWVRMLVRIVAVSSVTATATLGNFLPMIRGTAAGPTRLPSVTASVAEWAGDASPAPADSYTATGRETPYSLANSLGQPGAREQIIELNTGRETPDGSTWTGGVFPAGMEVLLPPGTSISPLLPDTPPGSPTAVAAPSSDSGALSFASGLGTALLLSAGAVSLLEARRRRQWRAAGLGARLPEPTPLATRTEVLLRSLSSAERLARLDVALRAAATDLVDQRATVLAAVLGDAGEIRLHLRGTGFPSDSRWTADADGRTWYLPGTVSLTDLAPAARQVAQPCPAMAHLGATDGGGGEGGGDVFVDLEAVGTLTVDSPWSVPILRAIACSLALSPFMEVARLFTVGLDTEWPGANSSESADSLDAAVDAATMTIGSLPSFAATTFALRTSGSGGEAWEPAIVVATGETAGPSIVATANAVGGGRGLAIVTDSPGFGGWCLRAAGSRHLLEPLGLVVHPTGVAPEDLAGLREVLAATVAPPAVHAPVVPIDIGTRCAATFIERDWSVLVRVLGPVDVVAASGARAEFERSKSLELVVWLSQHRERPTRTAARTALWDIDVRDATFANVVSDARRATARAVAPPDGEEWVARTLTEDLPLHDGVCTDAELLAARVEHARGLPAADAAAVLRPGVELLGGLPFAGTSFLWTDAEGITSSLVLLATSAAIELANHYLALGDIEGVFWATGQGLKVLAGHEELIALRMRAHARQGDLAGVRSEWESYERALAADPWAAAEPAPKLVALRRDLLTPQRALA